MIFYEVLLVTLTSIIHVHGVSYGAPQVTGNITNYTLIAIGGVFVTPLLIGLIYTRITLYRFRRKQAASEAKNASGTDSSSSSRSSKRMTLPASLLRLLDMRSNPILRLWWKRQSKLYSNISDNDIEAQDGPDLKRGGTGATSGSQLAIREKPEKKTKKSEKERPPKPAELDIPIPEEGKKDKPKKKTESKSEGAIPEKKEKKDKARDESSPRSKDHKVKK
jgi:hypothetical protein